MSEQPKDEATVFAEVKDNLKSEIANDLKSDIANTITKEFAKRADNVPAQPKDHNTGTFGEWIKAIAQMSNPKKDPDERGKAYNMLCDRYNFKTSMTTTTSTAGGYTVPVEYSRDLILLDYPDSVFFPTGGFIYPMASMSEKIPAYDYSQAGSSSRSGYGAGLQTGIISEASLPGSNTQPVFAQLTLTAEKYMSLTEVSAELLDTNIVGIQKVLTETIREETISQIDTACFNGDSGQFTGIDGCNAEVPVPRQTLNKITLQDVANMAGHVLPKRWSNYVWLVHPSAFPQLLQLADSSGRIIYWQNLDVTGKPAMMLMGQRVIITDIVSTLGTTGDICLIDPTLYAVGINKEIQIAVSYDYHFGYDTAVFRSTVRCAGAPRLLSYVTARDASTKLSAFILLKNLTS